MTPIEEIFLPLAKVAARYTCSTRKIYRLTAENIFPKPLQIGGSKKWALSDLMAYEESLRKGKNK